MSTEHRGKYSGFDPLFIEEKQYKKHEILVKSSAGEFKDRTVYTWQISVPQNILVWNNLKEKKNNFFLIKSNLSVIRKSSSVITGDLLQWPFMSTPLWS